MRSPGAHPMSLQYPDNLERPLIVVTDRIAELARSGGFLTPALRRLCGQNLVISKKYHRVLYLGLDALAEGKPLRDATIEAAWRFFIENDGEVVGAIESRSTADGTDRPGRLTEGPFVTGTVHAFDKAAELVGNESRQYTPVLVISVAVHISGLWLQTTDGDFDVVLPIPPIDRPFEPLRPMPLDQFTSTTTAIARVVRCKLSELHNEESPTRGWPTSTGSCLTSK
jgi:hypothetical protein